VLADCVARPAAVRELHDLAVEAMNAERKVFGFLFRDSPDTILHRSREVMEIQLTSLRRLADITRREQENFGSEGFTRLFATLGSELTDDYFAEIEAHLDELAFKRGTLTSARLGRSGKGTGYVLRRQPPARGWRDLLTSRRRDAFSFTVAERDEAGFRALSELTSRGVDDTANAMAQATDHVRGFFAQLRAELGFYLGCLNLRDRLLAAGMPVCYPVPSGVREDKLTVRGLYDAGLALTLGGQRVAGNDVDADGRRLIMVTGANQGGKSTFLRSVGQAQLMLQAGMFVPATAFGGSACSGLFTHFKREEDAAMEKGKLDEELERMSVIAGRIGPGGLLLCNESFASTNEREGSEIARQVIRALTENGIRIVFVTHLYDLAESFYVTNSGTSLFLRAGRAPDGNRTFRLPEGKPLPTSYGADLYREIFGAAPIRQLRSSRGWVFRLWP
jgi:MutS-like protein